MAWRKIQPALGIMALLLAVPLLSGCLEVHIESDFSNTAQVTHTVESTIDRSSLDQLQQFGGTVSDDFTNQDQAQQQAETQGFQYEPINTDDKVGARITSTITQQQADLGQTLNQFFTQASNQQDAQPQDG